jgi:hypothetical protein
MKPIHNLLRQRLYRTQKPLIEHPPIDLLSAFSERALSGSDTAPVLQHLADCADCREIVFLAAPQLESVGLSPAENRPDPSSAARWISWPVLRWGTVAACAVIVVAAVRFQPIYRRAGGDVTFAVRQSQQSAPQAARPDIVVANSGLTADGVPANVPPAARRLHTIPGKAKEVPPGLGAPSGTSQQMTSLAATGAASNDTLRILPPRWTLTADGVLQRSLDGGITWQQIQVSHDRIFRAVAAAGRSIWLGGQKGVLFHSADAGQHWTQLKRTAKRPLPDSDIIGIEFEDDQHGKLTTASNESWTTSDAGHSWEKQQ